MKKEHPILFSTPMVQALIAGRKTQTRRIVNPQPDDSGLWNDDTNPRSLQSDLKGWNGTVDATGESKEFKCRYGQPGDLLWVRESSAITYSTGPSRKRTVWYKADNGEIPNNVSFKWKRSIHMPKGAARIWLKVFNVKVQRLQDISEADAIAEGAQPCTLHSQTGNYTHKYGFQKLWEKINGVESWQANPWVWVIEFKVLSTTGNPILQNQQ